MVSLLHVKLYSKETIGGGGTCVGIKIYAGGNEVYVPEANLAPGTR